jgi:transcriptional pleiotropic regulator of transition state genes
MHKEQTIFHMYIDYILGLCYYPFCYKDFTVCQTKLQFSNSGQIQIGGISMKDITLSRKIDELGRLLLPIEARHALDISHGDMVSIILNSDDQTIMLKKCKPSCFCCQSTEFLKTLPHGKYICTTCLQQII